PVIVPAVVGGDVAVFKVGGVDVVLGLHLIGGVDQAAQGAIRVVRRVEREIVVGKGLGHGIHARVTAHAVVQKHPAVAAGAAGHVLADAVRRQGYVVHLFQVVAQMVEQGETEHGAVGAGTEEGLGGGAGGDHAGGRIGRQPVAAGLSHPHQMVLKAVRSE